MKKDEDRLVIAGREFGSRLIVGTSRYPDPHTMLEAIAASGAEMVTVAVDATVLPRSRWQTTLSDGARLEVVTAVQGG